MLHESLFVHTIYFRTTNMQHKPPNGLRYRRGGLASLLNIIAPNLTNCATNLGAIAPSGARCVRRHYYFRKNTINCSRLVKKITVRI